MASHDEDPAQDEERIAEIVQRGPAGTFAVVGVATVLVVAMLLVFYYFVFLPRGVVQ